MCYSWDIQHHCGSHSGTHQHTAASLHLPCAGSQLQQCPVNTEHAVICYSSLEPWFLALWHCISYQAHQHIQPSECAYGDPRLPEEAQGGRWFPDFPGKPAKTVTGPSKSHRSPNNSTQQVLFIYHRVLLCHGFHPAASIQYMSYTLHNATERSGKRQLVSIKC